MVYRVVAMASRQERNNFRVTGNPENSALLVLPEKGSRGYPLANDLCNRCSELLIWDAEAALRGFQMKPLA